MTLYDYEQFIFMHRLMINNVFVLIVLEFILSTANKPLQLALFILNYRYVLYK